MMKKKSKKLLLWLFVLTFVLTGIAGCGTKQKDDQEAASTETAGAISSVDDIVGKKIGVQLGTTGDIYVSDYENDGSGTTVERYNKGADAIQALKTGKIDAVVIDSLPAQKFVDANDDLKKAEKDGELTEDDLKKELDGVQKKTDKAIKDVDDIVVQKEKEIRSQLDGKVKNMLCLSENSLCILNKNRFELCKTIFLVLSIF